MSNQNVRFLVKLKKLATKSFQILTEAYGDETLSRAYVSECRKRFSGGRDSVEDDEHAVCPKSTITDKNMVKIRDMSELPLTSVVKLLINTTTLKY
ncbi:hypothetical protein TNCV_3741661 [Trichonephila clavipes]|nr:hypothetical protein TNCV_3741661 [Trichonephila clavipes]